MHPAPRPPLPSLPKIIVEWIRRSRAQAAQVKLPGSDEFFRLARPVLFQATFWITALGIGLASVLYARLVDATQRRYIYLFRDHPWVSLAISPVVFFLAVYLVRRLSPEAKGSGIPQVLQAIELGAKDFHAKPEIRKFVSLRTAIVKVLSTVLGIFAGASIGREGPTVQIAASMFASTARRTARWFPRLDFQSYLVAGGAVGVAAAFNTPLAGIAFALEEIGETQFPKFKESVMLSVIIGGIAAQALAGNYLYFGRPVIETPAAWMVAGYAVLIGLLGGVLGGVFARILSRSQIAFFPKHWAPRALACGIVCTAINFWSDGGTSGSSYETMRHLMDSPAGVGALSPIFFLQKFTTTALSYLSGMAGGIFSPCLSIGAGMGAAVAAVTHFEAFRLCALMGMVAFFSGVVQAPLTAVIIVTEMTDKHVIIIPLMVAAYLSQGVARQLMPVSLYKYLAFPSLRGSKNPHGAHGG